MKIFKIFYAIITMSALLFTTTACLSDFLPGGEDDTDGNGADNTNTPVIKSEYTVIFDTAGGTELPSRTVKAGAKCPRPYETIRGGANFVGWYYNDEPWDFATDTVNADITLTAKWDIITYKITYDLGGGSYSGNMPSTYTVESETLTLGTPVREDYEFLGWTVNGADATEIKSGSTGDKTVKALWFGLEAIVMPAKDGAKGIVVLIHDDAKLDTMAIFDTLLEKHGMVGDVGFLLNTVYNNGVVNNAALASYKAYINNGRWKIVNHSATHNWWGDEVNDQFGKRVVENANRLNYELVTSQAKMRELFPGQRVLTFAYPGFSYIQNNYTDGSLAQLKQIVYSPTARGLIQSNHIAARMYGGGSTKLDGSNADWNWMNAQFLSDGKDGFIDNSLDNALSQTVSKGLINVFSFHGLTNDEEQYKSDPGYYIYGSSMDKALEKISAYVETGEIWNTHYEDAVLYLREAETAKTTIKKDGAKITVTVTDDMPDDIYDMPLTLRVKNFGNWNAVKIVQGDTVQYAIAETVDGEKYLQFDALPDGGDVTISPISINDIPK